MHIESIKKQHNIIDVIGRYLPLKRKGKIAVGLCPFHDDHHPSLTVSPAHQTFACFACGTKGDVIEFIRLKEGCSFREALEKLGYRPEEKAVKFTSPKPIPPPPSRLPDHRIFLKLLTPYLTDDTQLTEVYRRFETGTSPHRVPEPWKYQAGRLVFPIRDEQGVLRGFSARATAPGAKAFKYIHTSSQDGFRSSELLYGLNLAKQAVLLTGNIFLVEGFKDVLAMHAAGVENCVGLMGTALSDKQAELLKRYAIRVYVVTDGDRPGDKAAAVIVEKLRNEQVYACRIELPGGEDPDSLYHQEGPDALYNRMRFGSAMPHYSEYLLITACLLYPKAQLTTNNNEPFARLVWKVITEEELPLEVPMHQQLLEGIVNGNIPETYRETVNVYVREYGTSFAEYRGTPEELTGYLKRVLFRYMEDRLCDETDKLRRQLKFLTGIKERMGVLQQLVCRKGLQEVIAGYPEGKFYREKPWHR